MFVQLSRYKVFVLVIVKAPNDNKHYHVRTYPDPSSKSQKPNKRNPATIYRVPGAPKVPHS